MCIRDSTNDLQVVEWGDCLPDCPTQEINPVCMMDPIGPVLKMDDPHSKNYTTDFVFGIGDITKGVGRFYILLQLML